MADPQQVLAQRVRHALAAAFGPEHADDDPVIRPSQFADYQSNAALPLGKRLGRRRARWQPSSPATWTWPMCACRPR